MDVYGAGMGRKEVGVVFVHAAPKGKATPEKWLPTAWQCQIRFRTAKIANSSP
jgi:hypothetical protein